MPTITPTGEACGAVVTDVDLTQQLDDDATAVLRAALDEHHVLVVPDQPMSNADLERFSTYFGDLGTDPWFVPIEGSDHIAEVSRAADETTPIFAEGWHSDWSFLEVPPLATCLIGIEIPPVGGDTLFANQHLAYERLPGELRDRIEDLIGKHSAKRIYGEGGMYDPDAEQEQGRSMQIVKSAETHEFQHPLIRLHEGNGRPALYSTLGYVQGIVGMESDEAIGILAELHNHQVADEVVYRHRWKPDMCVIWDNRSVLHRATGGYDGHARRLRRTTILPRGTATSTPLRARQAR